MQKLMSILRTLLAFWADIAQVFGLDWKSILAFGLGTGLVGAVIGFISGYGGFPLAIGAAAIGFLCSGAMAFSKYRKRPFTAPTRPKEKEIAVNRYAPPADTRGLDLRTATYKELGALLEATGREVAKFEVTMSFNATEEQILVQFHKRLARNILWAYGEARSRGHRDSTLENFYDDPGQLRASNIKWIGKSLQTMGASITIYLDK